MSQGGTSLDADEDRTSDAAIARKGLCWFDDFDLLIGSGYSKVDVGKQGCGKVIVIFFYNLLFGFLFVELWV